MVDTIYILALNLQLFAEGTAGAGTGAAVAAGAETGA